MKGNRNLSVKYFLTIIMTSFSNTEPTLHKKTLTHVWSHTVDHRKTPDTRSPSTDSTCPFDSVIKWSGRSRADNKSNLRRSRIYKITAAICIASAGKCLLSAQLKGGRAEGEEQRAAVVCVRSVLERCIL